MRRLRTAILALLLLATSGALAGPVTASAAPGATPTVSPKVQLFYYPWYGNPSVYGSYRHWPQGNLTPPLEISSNFYPKLGAYDSGDPAVLNQQMDWITQAGAGTIVYSWWGQGSYEDNLVPAVMAAAAQHGIKVAWHIEPYTGRTAASTVADIGYINSRYGSSPAFYRDPDHGNKPAFYIFQSLFIPDWTTLDQVTAGNIVLAQTTDVSKVAHFNGMYTYDGIAGATETGWQDVGAYCHAHGMVWSPSVAPGYLDDRAVPGNTTPTLDRANGATYDKEWTNAITPATGGNPDWVSVTSFNEWHEGSMIEPATSTPPTVIPYLTYDGAYGQTGTAAETSYLGRTRYWASKFDNIGPTDPPPPPVNTNVALHKTATASGNQGGFPASNITDGNASTYWESTNNAFPQTVTVDLGAASAVGRIVLKLPPSPAWGSRTQTLSVLGSVNGSAYGTLAASHGYSFDASSGNTVTITFPATTQRYLRLAVTANTGWPAGQASEFEAYQS
ncbi:MAG: hypothetical protein JWQ81_1981 [Amycolatopsis sp.]|jgi:glycoprotein endo-alpha-1,2-mannosidase|uniref:discoidin domain-containing protein n=1 Tax=Amycolatopsis sp. TaxID=37632 RepID=UPI00262F77DF|nr:discoidin domain-containing protein [Amycolatopsis sp.]MCU1681242.1 hypothetical protein [Amycolatopsis sp.]